MRKFIHFLAYSVILFNLLSCSNDDEEIIEKSVDGKNKLHAIYNGKDYFVEYEEINDSITLFKNNQEFEKLYNETLVTNPNLAIYYNDDSSIEYFDSYDELASAKKISSPDTNSSDIVTKTSGTMARVTFWDDTNYKDRSFSFLAGVGNWATITQFRDRPYRFNDKCSAFKLWYISSDTNYKGVLKMYEHNNYGGKVLVFEVSYYKSEVFQPRLKNLNFNDKMTSFILDIQPI